MVGSRLPEVELLAPLLDRPVDRAPVEGMVRPEVEVGGIAAVVEKVGVPTEAVEERPCDQAPVVLGEEDLRRASRPEQLPVEHKLPVRARERVVSPEGDDVQPVEALQVLRG